MQFKFMGDTLNLNLFFNLTDLNIPYAIKTAYSIHNDGI